MTELGHFIVFFTVGLESSSLFLRLSNFTILQVRSHQSGAEGQNHLPQPAGHASLDAAQDTVDLLGCECTLLAHVRLYIHQHPQVLLSTAALNPFIPQPVFIVGVALTQVQDPALGLVELMRLASRALLKALMLELGWHTPAEQLRPGSYHLKSINLKYNLSSAVFIPRSL